MRCQHCGNNLPDSSKFCTVCGSKIMPSMNPSPNYQQGTNRSVVPTRDQGSYQDHINKRNQQGPEPPRHVVDQGSYQDWIKQHDCASMTKSEVPVKKEPVKKKESVKLSRPLIFAISGVAVALIVAVVLIFLFAGKTNLGKIEVHLKHGDMILCESYSGKEIDAIAEKNGYEKSFNPKDGVLTLQKTYGLGESQCKLWFVLQNDGRYLFYRADVGRKGYGVEGLEVGQDFGTALSKYPGLVGAIDYDDTDGSTEWHLRLDGSGKVVKAHISLQEQYADPDDFDNIILKVLVASDGEIVNILVAKYGRK